MKYFYVTIISLTLIGSPLFAGGNCASKTAAFDTKIKNALEIASFDDITMSKLNKLTADCHFEYNSGISTYQTNSCKKALDLVGLN